MWNMKAEEEEAENRLREDAFNKSRKVTPTISKGVDDFTTSPDHQSSFNTQPPPPIFPQTI